MSAGGGGGDDAPAGQAARSGYYYWHDSVAKGEGAAPPPEQKPLKTEPAAAEGRELPLVTIHNYAFMDDDEVIKLYVSLEGALAGVTSEDVRADFAKEAWDEVYSLDVVVRAGGKAHRLHAEKLACSIVPEECKWRVSSKSNKLIITLKKKEKVRWDELRAKVALPFRRGGGGPAR